jgi:PAS domain S-box-containing protein
MLCWTAKQISCHVQLWRGHGQDTPAFRFTRVNQKFCEIAGYSAEELLTKTYIGLTHPQDRQRDMKGLTRVLRAKTDSWSIEKRRPQRKCHLGGVNGACWDDTGRAPKIMAMIIDITARKKPNRRYANDLSSLPIGCGTDLG